jgi:molecular chaperone GrpE
MVLVELSSTKQGGKMADKKKAEKEVEEAVKELKETAGEKKDPKDAKIDELTNDLKRVQAEFENYKKRVEKENAKMCDYAKADVLKRFLSVLDSFELAFKNTEKHDEFVKGMELIFSQFHSFLTEQGVRPIETKNRKFDPYIDEVMLTAKSDAEEGTILEELQRGYKYKEFVLRHAKVKVAKKD